MGLLSGLIGSVTLSGVKGLFEGAGSLAKDIRSALTGEISADKKAELLDKATELEGMMKHGQLQINLQEAAHPSIFVSGWRPAIGWVGAIALGCYFIPQYLLAAILWVKISWAAGTLVAFPIGEPHGLLELVLGMLGLGALRAAEKIKGVARN